MSEPVSRKSRAALLTREQTMSLLSTACDIALVVDSQGRIRDVSTRGGDVGAVLGAGKRWVGRKWADLVVPDSQSKIVALIGDGQTRPPVDAPTKWRHVNYVARKSAPDTPVLHAAVSLSEDGDIIVFGRDLRTVATLQRRLTDAQFAFEAEVTRVRVAEQRYRALFQALPEPVVILDGRDARVMDANAAAQAVFDVAGPRSTARAATELVAPSARRALEAAISSARGARREEILDASPAGRKTTLRLSILSAGQAPDAPVFLRATPIASGDRLSSADDLGAAAPDALAATGQDGRIRRVNMAFAELAQIPTPELAAGEPIERWLGRDGVDADVLLATLRQRGAVRHYATVMRGDRGAMREVEINAQARPDAMGHVLAVRIVEGRMGTPPRQRDRDAGRTPAQLAELIGRVTLKELVRESTDAIERMCIEAALELARDNRAAAAEMLGLSRQSLYVKLHRYGLTEAEGPEDG
jgi:transcriptional regulator PpsR